MTVVDPDRMIADRAPTYLTLPTYDGTGQSTHPDVFYAPSGWGRDANGKAWHYWMAHTPYAGSDNTLENPSILVSDDGSTWVTPPGVTNPVAPKPSGGYNSDPDLELGPDGKLYMFYRPIIGTTETVCYRTTADGINWSAETVAISIVDAANKGLLSPTIVYDAGAKLWRMWTINGIAGTPYVMEMRTAASLTGPWSAPTTCTLTVPAGPSGAAQDPWHLDVIAYGGQYHMAVNSTGAGQSGTGGWNWLAVSSDGITWTVGKRPLTRRGNGGGFNRWDNSPYRACFVPVDSGTGATHRLFYSASGASGWRIGMTELRVKPQVFSRTSAFLPEDYAMVGWTCDPAYAVGASNTLASGTPTFCLIRAAVDCYVDSVFMTISTAGAGLTAGQNFLALYDLTGAQLAVSADLSTNLASTGNKQFQFTAPTRLIKAGETLLLVILSNGTTPPKFYALANPPVNINRLATGSSEDNNGPWRSGTLGSGLTALPSSITLSTAAQNAWMPFVGLSPAVNL